VIDLQVITAFVADHCTKAKDILIVYLFGSHAHGEARDNSDIDFGALVDHQGYAQDPLGASSEAFVLAAKAGQLFDVATDVLILNNASLELAYEVVATGICLYHTDMDQRLEYESKIKGMYFDFAPFLKQLRAGVLARVL